MRQKSDAQKFLAVLVVVLVVAGVVGLLEGVFHLSLLGTWGYGLMGAIIVLILMPATLTGTATRAYQDQQNFLNGVDSIMAGRGWRRKTMAGPMTIYHPPAFFTFFMDGLAVDLSTPGTATLTGPKQFLNLLKNIP